MIDQIFEMIMQEARNRPGKDLAANIYTVKMELTERLIKAIEIIRLDEARVQRNKKKSLEIPPLIQAIFIRDNRFP